jgi:hypothetical protein
MKIAGFRCEGVHGLADIEVELREGGAAPLVVVTGPPVSGKTRLLEVLVAAKELIAPYGVPATGRPWVRPGSASAKVTIHWELGEGDRTWSGKEASHATTESIFRHTGGPPPEDPDMVSLLRRYEHDAITGKLDYFPATRALVEHGPPQGTSAMEQRMVRLGKDPRKYSFIGKFLREIADDAASRQRFAAALERLRPTARFRTTASGDGVFEDAEGDHRQLLELSSSERDAVIFAATATLIDASHSVLLIDRPELHVDRAHLTAFVDGLMKLAPDVQLILASGAPEVARELGGVAIDLGGARRSSKG